MCKNSTAYGSRLIAKPFKNFVHIGTIGSKNGHHGGGNENTVASIGEGWLGRALGCPMKGGADGIGKVL
ncbi:hypothetical protein [Bartonella taylorii]|uniref:hypothetical protein n=1 Tax=Bartonella taylorii TaxID=33046 RepID=UPI001ABBB464|nr:hypothetical protein [Bartonella taylorii]